MTPQQRSVASAFVCHRILESKGLEGRVSQSVGAPAVQRGGNRRGEDGKRREPGSTLRLMRGG